MISHILLFIFLIVCRYISKILIGPALEKRGWFLNTVYWIIVALWFVGVLFWLPTKIEGLTLLDSVVIYMLSEFALLGLHWIQVGAQLNDELDQKIDRDRILSAWIGGRTIYFDDQYLVEIKPSKVNYTEWKNIYEITAYDAESLTIDMSVVRFHFSEGKNICIYQTIDEFETITQLMEKKFPDISKDWPNHIFNAEGQEITLYSYKSQIY